MQAFLVTASTRSPSFPLRLMIPIFGVGKGPSVSDVVIEQGELLEAEDDERQLLQWRKAPPSTKESCNL